MKAYQSEVIHVHIYSLDHSSSFMLAAGIGGAGDISNRLAIHATISHYWNNNERTFRLPLCIDNAACENSAGTGSKVKNKF
jgi:hypothetical protein